MLVKYWLDLIPPWLIFVVTIGMVLGCLEGGFKLAVMRKKEGDQDIDAPIGSVVGGILGLLAFLLAFTFGMASSRYETRRELLLDEVNAIGTCYLRSEMIPSPEREEVRKLLREYVHLRAEVRQHSDDLMALINQCESLQDDVWSQAVRIARKDGDSEVHALFIDSLNDVIDFHTKRFVVARYHIPTIIWLSLYVIAMLSMMGVGYQFGRAGKRDIAVSMFLAVAFSIVIWLIADLDRVSDGVLPISQQPMIELDRKMKAGTP